jgi:hypothetical protein
MLHPLCGSNLSNLLLAFARGGSVRPSRLPQAAIALVAALFRSPFSVGERAWVAALRRRHPPMQAPLFIVGHLRSGTTHVQNVLSRSSQFGRVSPIALGLPWDMLVLGALLRPLLERALPEDRYVDQVRVDPDSPQEDEIALANMQSLSYYHGLYFPRRFAQDLRRGLLPEGCTPAELRIWRRRFVYFLQKVSIQQGGRRLLIKNPVYTARIALLREIWPEAQFIHVHRDPRRVFVSTVHYFRALLAQLALQEYDHVDVERTVLEIYPKVMTALLEQSAGLPPNRFVEVQFERFEGQPMAEVERIFQRLDLPGLEEAGPRFEAYLRSVGSYAKNPYAPLPETVRLVEREWARFVARWRAGAELTDG